MSQEQEHRQDSETGRAPALVEQVEATFIKKKEEALLTNALRSGKV
jgi:hypothetical protein